MIIRLLSDFFRGPDLPEESRRTYVRHLTFAVLDAAAAGILSNAGIMAVKGLAAQDWQLGLRLFLSSAGMFAALFLGAWMANKPKMPFVVVPGWAFSACSIGAAVTLDPFWFLTWVGIGSAFEVALRPAITAVLRSSYAATHRAAAVGEIRKWSSLVFLVSILTSAAALASSGSAARWMISFQMFLAAALSFSAYLVFRQIRTAEDCEQDPAEHPRLLTDCCRIVYRDKRFRSYLFSCFLFGFSGLLYAPFVAAVLVRDLGFGYVASSLFLHVIPAFCAFLTTGYLGRWIDRTNPWLAWALIRLGWAIDPLVLAAAPLASLLVPAGAWILPAVARIGRGASMGGSWVLWWRVGVNYFAPPGADTSCYMGVFVFCNGLMRLLAPPVGAWIIYELSRPGMLLLGGGGVILSALHARWMATREVQGGVPLTMADFEGATSARLQKNSELVPKRAAKSA